MMPIGSTHNSILLADILESLSKITLQIQQFREIEHILQGAIADARALLQTDRLLIYRFLSNQDAVVAFESVGTEWKSILGQLIYDPCLEATWIERYRQGAITTIPDIHAGHVTACYVELLQGLQVQANLIVPILSQGNLWGLLIVHHCRSPREWQPLEVQYLQQVALHLSIALQQSELRLSPQRADIALELHAASQLNTAKEALPRAKPEASETEHSFADSVLQASEERFRQLCQCAPVGIFLTDAAGHCTYVNNHWCELTQLTIEQAVGEGWQQVLHPEDRLHISAEWNGAVQEGREFNLEYRLLQPDGGTIWVAGRAIALKEPNGNISGFIGTVHDVSQVKCNEVVRKQREELIQNIAQGVSATTGEAFFQSLVQYLIRLLGMDQAFVGELIPPQRDRVNVIAGMANGQSLDGWEYSLIGTPCENVVEQGFCIYPDQIQQRFPEDVALQTLGGEGYVGISLVNSTGTVIGIIGVISNQAIANIQFIQEVLTIFAGRAASELERQQAETRLRRYEKIVSATPDCVSLLDHNYVYQVINQTYLTWNQKSYDEIVGHSISDLLGQEFFETLAKPYLDLCLAGETEHIVEAWLNYPDGQRRFTRATYAPYVEKNGTISGVVINVHDLTALKQAELENQSLRERLQFLLSASPGVIYSCKPEREFSCTFISENITPLFGYTPADFLAEPDFWANHIHPEDTSRIFAELFHLFEQGYHIHEYRFQHHDGHYCWVRDELRLVQKAEGEPIEAVGCFVIIDDRKQAEDQLRNLSDRLNLAIQAAKMGIWDWDIASDRLIWDDRMYQLYGIQPSSSREEYQAWEAGIHPEDLLADHQIVQQALAGEQDFETEFRLVLPDGTIRYLETHALVQRNSDGQPLRMIGVNFDISDRKAAEVALHQQVEREKVLMAIAQHIRQTLDLDQILHTTVTEVRQFLQTDRVLIYRFEADWSGTVIAESVAGEWRSILGMHITDIYFVNTQGNTYKQGNVKATDDIYIANLDPCHVGLLEQMQVRAKLVVPILQNNNLWGLLVAQHCRSPRHWEALEIELQQQLATQIAIALQQSELYQQVQTLNTGLELQVQERTAQLQQALDFEALLQRMTDHVRDSLDEGQILQAAVEELAQGLQLAACDTGIYNSEQTTSTIAYEFTNTLTSSRGSTFDIATAPHAEIYPYLLSGQICHFSDVCPNPLRSDQYLLTTLAVPIVDDQGVLGDLWLFKPPQGVFNDLEVRLAQQVANQCAIAVRQSRLYQAAQAQVQELERLNQLKDDFLSTVSHEMRSPMSGIEMATRMLEISLRPLGVLEDESSPINRYVKILREEGQREMNLINDLLDLTRLDAGTEPLSLTTIALQFYIPHLAEPFIERTHQQDQQLAIHIPNNLPLCTFDLPYLERILTELLHNACKYTPAGGIITVSAQAIPEALEIRVSNSGVEIPPVECDRIFDKFYRIPNNDPWKHGGTGLGLALVKKLTERLGGNVRVESGQGQTTFILQFGFSP